MMTGKKDYPNICLMVIRDKVGGMNQ